MQRRIFLIAVAATLLAASTAMAGTAAQYRGPANESPRGLTGPGDGVIGSERLVSRSRQVEGLTRWEFWWEMNRERFLRMAFLANGRTVSDEAVASFVAAPSPADQVTGDQVKLRIVPAVVARLKSRDPQERSLAALSLGEARVSAAFGPLHKMLSNGSPGDRRAAAIALGLLGEPLAAPALHELVGRRGVAPAERAYAALAIGFLGDAASAPVLRTALKESLKHRGAGMAEFQSACATGLGMLKDRASIPMLSKVARRRANRADIVRPAAICALGRIGDSASVPLILPLMEDGDVEVRRATAQALGVLAEAQAKPSLLRAFESDGDISVRNFAALALARIGGPDVDKALLAGLSIRNPKAVQGFSALALGLTGRPEHAPRLRSILNQNQESSLMSAAAIALGLLRDSVSWPALRAIAGDRTRNPELRGYAILSLAMQGDPVTRGRLRVFARETGAIHVRRSATMAMGLYEDGAASRSLLASLFEETDPWVRGAAISALSLKARSAALDPLLGILESRGFSKVAKKDALAALGVMARGGRPSAIEDLAANVNYRSMSDAVATLTALF